MEFVDTHCHIQEATNQPGGDPFMQEKWLKAGYSDPTTLVTEAFTDGVTRMICVGCTLKDSEMATSVAETNEQCWASVGIHPHEATHYVCEAPTCLAAQQPAPSSLLAHRGVDDSSTPSPYHPYDSVRASSPPSAASKHKHNELLRQFSELAKQPKVVAIGECGLDYFYAHSPKTEQIKILELQLQLAQDNQLPLILHVREAFDDFWSVFDNFKNLKGVVHSFSAHQKQLDEALARGLYIGLNGIMTFTKDEKQLAAAKAVPLERLLLETDAPFLTPHPYRGKICQPKHVRVTAEFLAGLRGESMEKLADATTTNAITLFKL